MHNLVTLLNYQTRLTLHAQGLSEDAQVSLDRLPEDARQKIIRPAEQLLRYMLFSHEAPLGGADAARVIAASPFARQFAAQGRVIRSSAHCATLICMTGSSAIRAAI
jgi:hypothetical protein